MAREQPARSSTAASCRPEPAGIGRARRGRLRHRRRHLDPRLGLSPPGRPARPGRRARGVGQGRRLHRRNHDRAVGSPRGPRPRARENRARARGGHRGDDRHLSLQSAGDRRRRQGRADHGLEPCSRAGPRLAVGRGRRPPGDDPPSRRPGMGGARVRGGDGRRDPRGRAGSVPPSRRPPARARAVRRPAPRRDGRRSGRGRRGRGRYRDPRGTVRPGPARHGHRPRRRGHRRHRSRRRDRLRQPRLRTGHGVHAGRAAGPEPARAQERPPRRAVLRAPVGDAARRRHLARHAHQPPQGRHAVRGGGGDLARPRCDGPGDGVRRGQARPERRAGAPGRPPGRARGSARRPRVDREDRPGRFAGGDGQHDRRGHPCPRRGGPCHRLSPSREQGRGRPAGDQPARGLPDAGRHAAPAPPGAIPSLARCRGRLGPRPRPRACRRLAVRDLPEAGGHHGVPVGAARPRGTDDRTGRLPDEARRRPGSPRPPHGLHPRGRCPREPAPRAAAGGSGGSRGCPCGDPRHRPGGPLPPGLPADRPSRGSLRDRLRGPDPVRRRRAARRAASRRPRRWAAARSSRRPACGPPSRMPRHWPREPGSA